MYKFFTMYLNIFAVAVAMLFCDPVESLDPYQLYAEGSCTNIQQSSLARLYVPVKPAENLDKAAVDQMHFIMEGSRFHLQRHVSPHPRYNSMTESELVNNFCAERNSSTTSRNSIAAVFGFGQILSTYDIVPQDEQSGTYIEAIPRSGFPRWDSMRSTVTMTDNRSFAVIVTCWTGSDQIGWYLVTLEPTLEPETKSAVERHARQMGFDPDNFLELNHDQCEGQRRSQPPSQSQAQRRSSLVSPTPDRVEEVEGLGPRRVTVRPSVSERPRNNEGFGRFQTIRRQPPAPVEPDTYIKTGRVDEWRRRQPEEELIGPWDSEGSGRLSTSTARPPQQSATPSANRDFGGSEELRRDSSRLARDSSEEREVIGVGNILQRSRLAQRVQGRGRSEQTSQRALESRIPPVVIKDMRSRSTPDMSNSGGPGWSKPSIISADSLNSS